MLNRMQSWLFGDRNNIVTSSDALNVQLPKERLTDKVLSKEDESFLQTQWNLFNKLSRLKSKDKQRTLEIKKGTLVHGSSFDIRTSEDFNFEKLEKIAKIGIVSGELLGIPEDDETHYCADFFKCRKTQKISDYVSDCWRFIKDGSMYIKPPEHAYIPPPHDKTDYKIAFMIENDQRLAGLLFNDAYTNDRLKSVISYLSIEGSEAELVSSRVAAILVGVPANFITGMIVSLKIYSDLKLIDKIRKLFPNANIYTPEGNLL